MPRKRERLTSHVGLYYKNSRAELFTFQLLNSSKKAVAGVDFTDGVAVRVLFTKKLDGKQKAIIRLGAKHLGLCRRKDESVLEPHYQFDSDPVSVPG